MWSSSWGGWGVGVGTRKGVGVGEWKTGRSASLVPSSLTLGAFLSRGASLVQLMEA